MTSIRHVHFAGLPPIEQSLDDPDLTEQNELDQVESDQYETEELEQDKQDEQDSPLSPDQSLPLCVQKNVIKNRLINKRKHRVAATAKPTITREISVNNCFVQMGGREGGSNKTSEQQVQEIELTKK
eukprot:sb/3475436/